MDNNFANMKALIQLLRRLENVGYKVYNDSFGYPTIGIGHRVMPNDPVLYPFIGDLPIGELTDEEVNLILQTDIDVRFHQLQSVMDLTILRHEERDALLSFIFNVGIGNQKRGFLSSSVYKNLTAGKIDQAADAMLLWNKATDPKTKQLVVSDGLTKRRIIERAIFKGRIDDLDTFGLENDVKVEVISIFKEYMNG